MENTNIKNIIRGARSENKMNTHHFVNELFPTFFELHGDRVAGDDAAIISGFSILADLTVAVIATNKGADLQERIVSKFGCPSPSGYRKALRAMKISEQLHIPILTFLNTSGAYPGAEAEKEGQGQVISKCISKMIGLQVPILTIIVGEAGSGGALALACSDEIWMFEHSMYTVLSPEGFSSIMWKSSKRIDDAAEKMHIEPNWLKDRGVVERILPEKYLDGNLKELKFIIGKKIKELNNIPQDKLLKKRQERFRKF